MHWLSDWCIFTRLSCVFMLKIVFFFSEISSFINQRQGKKPYFVIFKWQPCKFENTVFFLFSSLLLLVWLRINNFFSHIRPFWRFAWGFFFLLLSRFLFLVILHTFFSFCFYGQNKLSASRYDCQEKNIFPCTYSRESEFWDEGIDEKKTRIRRENKSCLTVTTAINVLSIH